MQKFVYILNLHNCLKIDCLSIFDRQNIKYDCLHASKRRLKISQLKKVRFIKVNELRLTQIELLSFFLFKSVKYFII